MPLLLQPAISSDIPTLISIYFAAFQNPLALNGFPDVPSVRKWWTEMIRTEFSDPNALFLKVIDQGKNGEEVIAWAKWCGPVDKEPDVELPVWPEGGDHALCDAFFSQLAEKHKKNLGARRHWCTP